MRVGTGPLFSMAMALGVKKRLQQAVAQYGLAEGELWEHSVAAALTVESLGARLRRKLPVESFPAALLHDVGKLVMARFLEPSHLASLRAAEEHGRLSERDAELEILGVDHAELGAVVAQYWSLPEALVHAIQFHHSPELAFAMDPYCRDPADAAAHVVHVADLVSERVAARRKKGGPALPQEPLAEATSAASSSTPPRSTSWCSRSTSARTTCSSATLSGVQRDAARIRQHVVQDPAVAEVLDFLACRSDDRVEDDRRALVRSRGHLHALRPSRRRGRSRRSLRR